MSKRERSHQRMLLLKSRESPQSWSRRVAGPLDWRLPKPLADESTDAISRRAKLIWSKGLIVANEKRLTGPDRRR